MDAGSGDQNNNNNDQDFAAAMAGLDLKQGDDTSFADLMRGEGITRMAQDKIAGSSPLLDKNTAKIRQEAATTDREQLELEASSAFVPMVDPNEVLSFRRSGVQPYVLTRLKKGEYIEADYIDLHGKTVEQAYDLVMRFLEHARREEFRCVLIIHGKGSRGPQRALLKSYTAHWLRQIPEVQAFHSAPAWKGGTGSVLVILKKGDKSRAETRELHSRRQISRSTGWK